MDSQVFHAAQNGNINEIERLYGEKPEILREVTLKKSNVLHIAAREGYSDFVRWILRHVQDSSMSVACDSYLNTPLHEAAQAGDADLVKMFISQAAHAGYADLLSIFISLFRRGSDEPSNWVNSFGETPLLIACRYGREEAVTVLLEKSTPINLRSPKYQPCLHVAASGGHLDVVKLLLSKSNMERFREVWMMLDAHGATPLHAAIYGGHTSIVSAMLNPDLGSSWRNWLMTKEDSDGNCGIHASIVKGKYDIVDCLMSSMPDCIEIRRADGNTALHLAAENAVDPQIVEHLLSSAKVKVNVVNNEGLTPLDIAIAAVSRDSTNEIRRILKEHGASANYKLQFDNNGVTRSVCFNEVRRSVLKEKDETENKVMDVDTLVASLIATVTFAAIFQVPGGIDDNTGVAKLTFQPFFTLFLVSDMVALFTSLIVVIGWIFGERLQKRSVETKSIYMFLSALSLGVSIASTAFTFISAAFLVIIPNNITDLETEDEEAFHKYQSLYRLVVYLATIPMTIAIICQTCCLCMKRVGHTWRGKAAAVMLAGMAAMFIFFCVYQYRVEKQLWSKEKK